MHIAVMSSADLSYDSGSVVFAKQLINHLVDQGSEVSALSNARPAGLAISAKASIAVRAPLLEHPIITDRFVSDEQYRASEQLCDEFLAQTRQRCPIDVIYAQYLGFAAAAAVRFGMRHAIPVVVSSFGRDTEPEALRDARLDAYARFVTSHVRHFIVPSTAVRDRVRRLYFKDRSGDAVFAVVPPPLDGAFLSAAVPDGGTSFFQTTALRIASVNSCFKPDKGIETILQAVALFRERNATPVEVVIAGKDDHPQLANHARIAKLLQSLNLAQMVSLPGYLSRAHVKRLLAEASVFVDARRSSGFSSALLEALSADVPICCSRSDGSLAIAVDGVDALMFDAGDAGALCRCLERVGGDWGSDFRLKRRGVPWMRGNGSRHTETAAMGYVMSVLRSATRSK